MSFHKHVLLIRRTVRVAALGVALALAPSPALSEFGSPVPLTPAGETADQAKVAINARGEALAALLRVVDEQIILVRKKKVGPATGRPISARNVDASNPVIEVNRSGVHVVTYEQGAFIQARIVSAANVLGPILSISKGSEPVVSFTRRELVHFAWQLALPGPSRSGRAPGDQRIQARSASAAGVLGPVKNISPANGDASAPRVVADADGDALFVWLHDDGSFLRVQARSLSAAGVLGPIQNISPAGSDADHPQVAMTAGGRAVIVWQRFNATFSEAVIETRTRTPAGALGAVVPLTSPGTYSVEPQVALDAAGDALFIWELQALPNSRVQARHRSAAGVLKPVQNITAATGFAYDAQVARSPAGEAVIIWSRNSSGGNIAVQARTRADAGPLGPIQTLSNGPIGTNHPSPRIAINDDGDAVAVWGRFDGSNNRIWAAFGP